MNKPLFVLWYPRISFPSIALVKTSTKARATCFLLLFVHLFLEFISLFLDEFRLLFEELFEIFLSLFRIEASLLWSLLIPSLITSFLLAALLLLAPT